MSISQLRRIRQLEFLLKDLIAMNRESPRRVKEKEAERQREEQPDPMLTMIAAGYSRPIIACVCCCRYGENPSSTRTPEGAIMIYEIATAQGMRLRR